jgi:signal transduction histidine kinase
LGLDAATKWYAETIERRANIPIHVDSCGDARVLSTDYNTVLFRILQEALGNVVKHADASSVEVALKFDDNHATLTVTDDGRGFEPPADFESAEQSGWGLAGMRERAALVGGTFDVVSAPGMGTAVTVRIPLPVVKSLTEDG